MACPAPSRATPRPPATTRSATSPTRRSAPAPPTSQTSTAATTPTPCASPASSSSGPPPPPPASLRRPTTTFVHGGDAEVQPGWPLGADKLSILVQMTETLPGGAWLCKIDFLVRDLAVPLVRPGVVLLIMEGPKVVATAVVTAVAELGEASKR